MDMKVNIYNTNSYGKRKPCHERKTPRPHLWDVNIIESYGDGHEATVVCYNCLWGFDLDFIWAEQLPTDDTLFRTEDK